MKSHTSMSTSDFVASLRGAASGEMRREKRGRTSSAEASPAAAKRKHGGELLSVSVGEWISKATTCPISSPEDPSVMDLSAAEGSVVSLSAPDTAPSGPRDLVVDSSSAGQSNEEALKGISEEGVGSHVQGQLTSQRKMINYQVGWIVCVCVCMSVCVLAWIGHSGCCPLMLRLLTDISKCTPPFEHPR